MEELLQYDLSPASYLFDKDGLMNKPLKSALVHELESKLTKDDTRTPAKETANYRPQV